MGRVITDQKNLWGKSIEAQRADLWVVDFSAALSGLAKIINDSTPIEPNYRPSVPTRLATYFCSSISLPELKVRAEPVRRDSRPYQMPSWDEPCDAVRMTFILDSYTSGRSSTTVYRSDLYRMLEAWRMAVRAGRGPMGGEYAIRLNNNYSIDFSFNVGVAFLRGNHDPASAGVASTSTAQQVSASTLQSIFEASVNNAASSGIQNDLEFSMKFQLIDLWLSSFKIIELAYETSKITTIEAVFYAENIQQETSTDLGTGI